ncbi:Crp/Fnr family transcriptional regulator [Pedobacter yonginense]|uniref:Crp/Fnr family transcriptional regulator n=1 Tax=Pedobacter yonginense TaxID=651869 RepID=A0A317EW84_9SPHI|nr:PQQ-dependent sugar dehydrogenase [Pedobacter yonginense]PWS29476.1 Crp/Fnr family transcriptional regulator [Pedobacter yonginense]
MKTFFTLSISFLAITFLYATTLNSNRYTQKKIALKSESRIDTPDQDRFVSVKLVQGEFTEPTELTVLPNLDILVAQRRGEIMLYKNQTKKLSLAGKLDVYFKTNTPDVNAEEGLLGMAADPKFAINKFIYLFYSPFDKSVNRLSRFKMVNDKIDKASEKIILQFYSQREICCHTGGSIAFGADNLLYVSTGDNSTPFDVPKQQYVNNGYAPLDNRKGLEQYDARRSAGNTNDLRGKILRIKLKDDGTYSIPDGNLFPKNDPKAKPEIYVMGNRNPYRISVDQKTGYLYWGEVGPDASNDDAARGPRGYDEVNQARKAGNFGWPYFIGNNYPYRAYDYTNGQNGNPFDPAGATNNSPNNTGLGVVPPAQPAFIWYPYGESKEFPQVGSGGRTAMAGPVYYAKPGVSPYPAYYNGKLIIYEWIRGWVKAITMSPQGDYISMEPMLSKISLAAPIDMELGPDGKLYILEYGKGWFSKNPDAGITRIDYLKGNRPPKIESLEIAKTSGLLPYKLTAKVKAVDPDGDALTYIWNLGNGIKKTTTSPELTNTYTVAGEYPVSVTVSDKSKASAKSQTIPVFAGNEQPNVDIVLSGNKSFWFPNKAIDYQVLISDKGASINNQRVYISNTYTEGMDLAGAQLGHQQAAQTLIGKTLMLKSDCSTCHKISTTSIGPAFEKVSSKYQGDPNAVDYLANKVLKGSSGVWGEIPMPAHPAMKEAEVKKITEWIMTLSNKEVVASLPTSGKITPSGTVDKKKSVLNLKATYTDAGTAKLKPLTTTNSVNLKSNQIDATDLKNIKGFETKEVSGADALAMTANEGHFSLNKIDLTKLSGFKFNFGNNSNYEIEVRLDRLDGELLGKSESKSTVSIQPVTDGKFHTVYFIFKASSGEKPIIQSLLVESL